MCRISDALFQPVMAKSRYFVKYAKIRVFVDPYFSVYGNVRVSKNELVALKLYESDKNTKKLSTLSLL